MARNRMAQLLNGSLILITGLTYAASTNAEKEVFYNWTTFRDVETRSWYAATTSEKNENVAFGLNFSSAEGCEPVGFYSVPSSSALDRQDDGDYQKTLKFRVDEKTTWVIDKGSATLVTSLTMNKKFAVASLYLPFNANFVSELVAGKKMRMLIVESDITDRFDLKGAKVAIAMAQLGCMQEPQQQPDDLHQKNIKKPSIKTTSLPHINLT